MIPQWLVAPYSPVAQYDPEAKLSTPVGPEPIENSSGACLALPGATAMSAADKSGVAEPEESVIREGQTADAENPSIRGWYRGDLNGAYQEWREGGKPQDPAHPLTEKLLFQARLFAGRMFSKHIKSYHVLWYDDSRVRVEQANEKSIQRAMALHDHNRESGASFTTYVRKAVYNNVREEFRRLLNPTHQKELLRAHNGDIAVAHWWIDEKHPSHFAPQDRPLAHWLLDQNLEIKLTWRQVLGEFPGYKTEDTAGRALRRVKKAIEKAGFYRPLKGRRLER
jgi:hypothetical protein